MNRAELPPYTVRVHPRARRVRIRVSALDGVVVTLPPRAPKSLAAEAIAVRADWVREALARVADRREAITGGAEALLPEDVRFGVTGESWRLDLRLRPGRSHLSERDGLLAIAAQDRDAALGALRRWLQRAAARRLLPLLEAAATQHGIEYGSVTVRCQRSRWGSYSARGAISLNRSLVFLPPDEVRGVLLHELCHARHHDHSPAFWRELERMDAQCHRSRKALRHAAELVPPWALRP